MPAKGTTSRSSPVTGNQKVAKAAKAAKVEFTRTTFTTFTGLSHAYA